MTSSLPPVQRKQLLDGNWDVAEGAAFAEFNIDQHVIAPFELPSWWERFNFTFPYDNWEKSLLLIPVIVLIQLFIFRRFRLYRGMWRFASIPDLWNIYRASIIGALCITLFCFIAFRLEGIPRSILILYPFFLMFFLGAPRLTYRTWRDHTFSINSISNGKRAMVLGWQQVNLLQWMFSGFRICLRQHNQ